eukprot:Colp12_sorted_trinity150504_noHs@32737
MADLEENVEQLVTGVAEAIGEAVNNATEAAAVPNESGLFVAYSALLVMAVVPIIIGSHKSVTQHAKDKAEKNNESMTAKDAAMFPFIASASLFGLYVFFRIFDKEHVNLLLSIYFVGLGIFAIAEVIKGPVSKVFPSKFLRAFKLSELVKGETKAKNAELVLLDFTTADLAALFLSLLFGVWYFLKKHWIANNILGLAFSVNGIEMLRLGSFQIGCILLSGLFFYDVFWVFGTDVMVTVAKSFD